MSVIQKIRDKYARVAVIAIALALLGFILMDAFAGRGSVLGGNDTTLGKINGKKIEYDVFNRRVADITQRQGNRGADLTQQVVNGLWQQEISDVIMGEQYEELGITVTTKELDQLIYSQNPSPLVLQAFGNPQNWDPNLIRQRFNEIRKSGSLEEKQQLTDLIKSIEDQTKMTKYQALLTNAMYVPKWFLEKRNADNSQMANASYVAVPYTSIADSTVKVSDEEINNYIQAHRKDFEQKEESRTISYVQFSAAPSSADSATARNQLLSLKDSFQRSTDAKEFLLANRSDWQYNDMWMSKTDLTGFQNVDTITNAPNGVVVGPIVENGKFVLSKIIDRKTQPDTAKVRHILIGIADPNTGAPTRDTVAAKRLADSIRTAITNGASFDSLLRLSEDPGKVANNGVYDSVTRNAQFVQEFKDFALNNAVGTKGVVRTQFGYHYMEVLNQRGNSPVFKLALFSLPIEASAETQTAASNAASMFAGNATNEKSFRDYFEKNVKGKRIATTDAPLTATLRPLDFNVTGIEGSARELVRDAFNAEKGDVLDPKSIGNSYIVALVTDVQKEGVPSASSVRTMVEPILINKKKAEQIKKQMGTVTDLNAVAAKFNQQVLRADSTSFGGGGNLGYETKVLGAIFNPNNKGKVVAEGIAGQLGVYAIQVQNTFTTPINNADIEQQRQMMLMQGRQQYGSPDAILETLKKKAEIKDYRAKFY